MKLFALAIALLMLVTAVSANVTQKELVISGETPNFYGVFTTNESEIYVTGYPTSLQKTLNILNSIDIGGNFSTVVVTGSILT